MALGRNQRRRSQGNKPYLHLVISHVAEIELKEAKVKNRIVLEWNVTPEWYKELANAAKQWGHKSVEEYMKSTIEAKLGPIAK